MVSAGDDVRSGSTTSARSSAPRASSRTRSCEPPSSTSSWTPGYRSWKALSTSGSRPVHRLGVAPSRTRPRRSWATS
ncbi:hypothetical protein M2169_000195 [Streptomyces sp. MJP52]|nr:hypothetical protein [Streptomyces sp. MJP52]